MTIVDEYIDQIEKIKLGLSDQAENIIKDNEQKILDYNRQDQLFNKGIDSKGRKLSTYAESTKRIKRKKGLPTDRTTLKNSGDFYRGFWSRVYKENLEINSDFRVSDGIDSDGKNISEILTRKYGKEIFGLTKENNDKVNDEIILPKLLEWSLNQMKL